MRWRLIRSVGWGVVADCWSFSGVVSGARFGRDAQGERGVAVGRVDPRRSGDGGEAPVGVEQIGGPGPVFGEA